MPQKTCNNSVNYPLLMMIGVTFDKCLAVP